MNRYNKEDKLYMNMRRHQIIDKRKELEVHDLCVLR